MKQAIHLPKAKPRAVVLTTQLDTTTRLDTRSGFGVMDGVAVALLGVALLLWLLSLSRIDVVNIPDVGLSANLPRTYFAAIGVLTVSFALLLVRNPDRSWPWLTHTLMLILILHGTLPLVYDEPRFGWVYKHIGVTGFIQLNGTVSPIVDAYHNWPGFFAVAAMVTDALGLQTALPLARWAQPVFNLLYLIPLFLIFRALARDRRVIWLAAWLFFITNFISQDYFAPQAFAYLLYLIVIAILLTWFGTEPLGRFRLAPLQWLAARDPNPAQPDQRLRLGMGVLALIVFAAVAASHQLTPFAVIAAVAALTLTGRNSSPWLLLGILLITLAWNTVMAATYFEGQTSWRDTIGRFFSNFQSLPDTLQQTEARMLVARAMRFLVLGLWGLAVIGVIRRSLAGRIPSRTVALALAPFPLVLLGSYGGEIMLRIYFFSEPFMALLAAWAFFPARTGRPSLSAISFGAISLGLTGLFLVSYLGKESQNRILSSDVRTMTALYRDAKPGSIIATVTDGCCIPFKIAANYDRFAHLSLIDDRADRDRVLGQQELARIDKQLEGENRPVAYFIFSKALEDYFKGNNILAPNGYRNFQSLLRRSGWQVFLQDTNTVILEKQNPKVRP